MTGITGNVSIPGLVVRGLTAALALLFAVCYVHADFNEVDRRTAGSGGAVSSAIAYDVAGNVYIVSEVSGRLQVDLFGPCLRAEASIPGGSGQRGEPRVVTGSRGEAVICFSERRADTSDSPRDIYLTHNAGGVFVEPVRLSEGSEDNHSPELVLDHVGTPHVAWTAWREGSPVVLYYNSQDEEIQTVAPGLRPSICIDSNRTVHLLYQRGERLYCNNNAGGVFAHEFEISGTPATIEPGASIAGTRDGRLVVSYAASGSLFVIEGSSEEDFSSAVEVDSGGIRRANLEAGRAGGLSLVYIKDGDIYRVNGNGLTDLVYERVGSGTPELELRPHHTTDTCDITHVVFLRDGEVFYTNDAQDPGADFTADRTHGEMPLTIQFEDTSAGKAQGWHWDFGDGGTSLSENPVYTYRAPGRYTVSLTVYVANRATPVTREEYVVVEPPSNTLSIPDQRLKFGQGEAWFPVYATHREPIMAYQLHGVFDPDVLLMQDCSLLGTPSVRLRPEVWECNIFEQSFEIGCLYDFTPPIDGRVLPPGNNQILTNLQFTVAGEGDEEVITRIDLVNDRELSPILNIFTVNNQSRLPVLDGASVTVYPADHHERLFVRGDVNFTGNVDITDAIYLLGFLFMGYDDPECLDPADTLDDGRVNISSSIYLLNFLFTGGPAPRVPYPSPGLDPTLDDAFSCEN